MLKPIFYNASGKHLIISTKCGDNCIIILFIIDFRKPVHDLCIHVHCYDIITRKNHVDITITDVWFTFLFISLSTGKKHDFFALKHNSKLSVVPCFIINHPHPTPCLSCMIKFLVIIDELLSDQDSHIIL